MTKVTQDAPVDAQDGSGRDAGRLVEPMPTTVYLERAEWEWLKQAASDLAVAVGGRASVSRVIRDMVRLQMDVTNGD